MIQRSTQFIGEIPQVIKLAELPMFVVHGDMSTLEADAYLIPSDSYASVTERWDWLLEAKREFIHTNNALLSNENPLFLPQLDAESPISMVVNIAGEQVTNSVDALARRFREAATAFDWHVRTSKNSDTPRVERIAILDIDAHHGDGTEALTRENSRVFTLSVHDKTAFPGSGKCHDEGSHVFNRPLKAGSGDLELKDAVDDFIMFTDRYFPDMIFIAMGAEGHETDPLSSLNYSVEVMVQVIHNVRRAYQPDTITPKSGPACHWPRQLRLNQVTPIGSARLETLATLMTRTRYYSVPPPRDSANVPAS